MLASAYHLPIMYALPMIYLTVTLFMVGFVYMGAGTRVMLAAARSRLISQRMGEIHPRYYIPYWALIAFGLIGAAIIPLRTHTRALCIGQLYNRSRLHWFCHKPHSHDVS
jgi:amino acid transporter